MNKSESIKNISAALISFSVKVEKVKKDATNPFFKSKYATLSNILEAIHEPLIESGLSFSQFPTDENGLTTILMHAESGEYLESTYSMRPVKDDPQGRGSVITYQRRYALAAVLGLNIDDDDANTATHGGATPEKAAENNLPWLNEGTREFEGAVEKMKAGKSSIKALRAYFKISKKVEEKLNLAANVPS
jgi:hypothetical protein